MQIPFQYYQTKWLAMAKRWSLLVMVLFVTAQTEGLLHAEIHHFHEHEASCDIFDNLAQPFSSGVHVAHAELNFVASDAYLEEPIQVFNPPHVSHFLGRAPPLA